MTLDDLYNQLTAAEFSELKLGSTLDGDDGMTREAFSRLMPMVQQGLTALHTRLFLKEGSTVVPLVENTSLYTISTDDVPDLLKIQQVKGTYNAKEYSIPLNKMNDAAAIRTRAYNQIAVPTDSTVAPWLTETTSLEVIYQANHLPLETGVADSAPFVQALEIPPQALEALAYYVAARVQTPRGAVGEFLPGNTYAAKYEAELVKLSNEGVELHVDEAFDIIALKGFV